MKLSTVRFVDDASRPQIFEQDLVAAHRLAARARRASAGARPRRTRACARVRARSTVCAVRFTVASPMRERLGHARAAPRARAPEDGAHARDELVHAERLRHVVVGARVEAADLVGLLRARGEHDDGHERVDAPELLAHGVAVHVGEHQVEDDRVGRLAPRERDALLRPSPAAITRKPSNSRASRSPMTMCGSSSTTRIVFFAGAMASGSLYTANESAGWRSAAEGAADTTVRREAAADETVARRQRATAVWKQLQVWLPWLQPAVTVAAVVVHDAPLAGLLAALLDALEARRRSRQQR